MAEDKSEDTAKTTKTDFQPLVAPDGEVLGHMATFNVFAANSPNCPKCGAPPSKHEVRNYDADWHDGDVHCTVCGAYVRMYDAG